MSLIASGGAGDISLAQVTLDTTGATFILFGIEIDYSNDLPVIVQDSLNNDWILQDTLVFAERINVYACVNPTVGVGHVFQGTASTFRRPAIAIMAFNDKVALPYNKKFELGNIIGVTGTVGDTSHSPDGMLVATFAGNIANAVAAISEADVSYDTVVQEPNGPVLGVDSQNGISAAYRYAEASQENKATWTASDPAIAGWALILLTFAICPTIVSLDPPIPTCGSDVVQLITVNGDGFGGVESLQLTDPDGNVTTPTINTQSDSVITFLAAIPVCGEWTLTLVDGTGLCSDPAEILFDTAVSGVYKLVPGKRHDTLYASFDPVEIFNTKIP